MNTLPIVIAGLVIVDQALLTFRFQLIVRGRRKVGSMLGVVNAALNLTAIGQVVTNLDQPENIVGYAAGVGIGTYLGSLAEHRVGTGQAEVRLITRTRGLELVTALRELGWPATASHVAGIGGDGVQIVVIADRRRVQELLDDIDAMQPDAIVSVGQLTEVRAPSLPPEFRQVAAR